MKRILLLTVLILTNLLSFAQYPNKTGRSNDKTRDTVPGGLKGNLIMYWYADTSVANAVPYLKGEPDIMIKTGGDLTWQRSHDAKRWVLIGGSICAGTQLISGSITWSGSGLVYDATDLDYYILCSRYFANSTTLTLAVADPTYPRIDKFYADITGAIGVITGTPATNPQEPQVNMLNQIDLGFVYIPAGSTVPAGTTQTVIYNENVEWTGTSDVPSINFAYATNPYIGSLSTYLPSAPNSSYVEWQSNGIDYLFSEAQYLKFWVRLNDNFVSEPLSFLDVTFEYTDVTVSQTLAVGNGDYNMDYSLINQWQLVSIPLTGITTYGSDFNEVHFVINSAPSSFQLDYVYLLETATVPPVISSGWSLNLNTGTNPTTNGIGTSDSVGVAIKTNSQTRLIVPANGIVELSNDELDQQLLTIRNDTIYKTNIPTAYGTLPIVVEVRNDSTFITCPTCDTTGGGGSGWGLIGNAGTVAGTNFIGTTDDVGLMGKVNSIQSFFIDKEYFNTSFGYQSLVSRTTGNQNTALGHAALQYNSTGDNNTALGYYAMNENITGVGNTGIGFQALQYITGVGNTGVGFQVGNNSTSLSTGRYNSLLGYRAGTSSSTADSSGAFGLDAASATRQMAFSPYFNTMFLDLDSAAGTAPAIAGIDASGNWRKYATPSSSSPSGNYGNIQINRNGAFDTPGGDSLSFSESSESLNVIGGIHVSDAVDAETGVQSYIRTTNDLILGDVTNGVYAQISGSNADNNLRLYSTGGNPIELHDDVTVIGNITAHNIIGATATQTDANFSATAGTAYVLTGNNSATRTITMPTLAEGDVFEFYNENTSANKWVSSATIYLSDNTTFTTLADDTNYILRYVGGKLRVSN